MARMVRINDRSPKPVLMGLDIARAGFVFPRVASDICRADMATDDMTGLRFRQRRLRRTSMCSSVASTIFLQQ